MPFRIRLLLLTLASGLFGSTLHAGQFDAIYAFGDSLSDVGNIFAATGGTIPGPPYANGQFSNGDIWIQDLALGLGLSPLTPSLLGGTDYAYGDAQSGDTLFHAASAIDLSGPTGQVSQYLSTHPTADPNALYTIWIGSNDLTPLLLAPPGSLSLAQIETDLVEIGGNVDTAIGTLAFAGAKNFLVVTVPDLGVAPGGNATASTVTGILNSGIVNGFGVTPSLADIAANQSLNIQTLDAFSLVDFMVANPAAFGLTNVTDPCLTGAVNFSGGTVCANPSSYLFWDPSGHPTAAADAFVADAALTLVTPEPASLSLLAVTMAAAGVLAAIRLRSV